MKRIWKWCASQSKVIKVTLGALTVLATIRIFLWVPFESQSETIKVALIYAVAAFMSILGSVLVVQLTNTSNARQQRAADVRRIKQQYYFGFFEAQWKKNAVVQQTPENKQAISDTSHAFGLEYARLPLYASQTFVEFVHAAVKHPETMATPSKFYELMREDLCSDDYTPFKKLNFDTILYPDPVDEN